MTWVLVILVSQKIDWLTSGTRQNMPPPSQASDHSRQPEMLLNFEEKFSTNWLQTTMMLAWHLTFSSKERPRSHRKDLVMRKNPQIYLKSLVEKIQIQTLDDIKGLIKTLWDLMNNMSCWSIHLLAIFNRCWCINLRLGLLPSCCCQGHCYSLGTLLTREAWTWKLRQEHN